MSLFLMHVIAPVFVDTTLESCEKVHLHLPRCTLELETPLQFVKVKKSIMSRDALSSV